jgi:hypothetical protein
MTPYGRQHTDTLQEVRRNLAIDTRTAVFDRRAKASTAAHAKTIFIFQTLWQQRDSVKMISSAQ